MNGPLFSIRMRASLGGTHLSGAERLAGLPALEGLAGEMTLRALNHSRGRADNIHISIDLVPAEEVLYLPLPDFTTVDVVDFRAGRAAAIRHLETFGVSSQAARTALGALAAGASPGGTNMRGAMLVDAASGVRLEPDPARGVRVSRMDLTEEADRQLRRELVSRNLDRPRVREALALAGKVLSGPGVVAELCWSDDPDYVAGYVAGPAAGYVRFPALKAPGDGHGGRAFFVRSRETDLAELVRFLERRPVLFDRLGTFHPDRASEA